MKMRPTPAHARRATLHIPMPARLKERLRVMSESEGRPLAKILLPYLESLCSVHEVVMAHRSGDTLPTNPNPPQGDLL